jgi:hypothetical protein
MEGRSGLVSVVDLANQWDAYEEHLRKLGSHMLGSTPMLEALLLVRDRFTAELRAKEYRLPPVLFLLSDGVPDSGTTPDVRQLARQLKDDGILIVSCYAGSSPPRTSDVSGRPHLNSGKPPRMPQPPANCPHGRAMGTRTWQQTPACRCG